MKLILVISGAVAVIALLVVFLVVPIIAQDTGSPTASQAQTTICPVTKGSCQGCYQGAISQTDQTTLGGKSTGTW